jgi:hypothetical protein
MFVLRSEALQRELGLTELATTQAWFLNVKIRLQTCSNMFSKMLEQTLKPNTPSAGFRADVSGFNLATSTAVARQPPQTHNRLSGSSTTLKPLASVPGACRFIAGDVWQASACCHPAGWCRFVPDTGLAPIPVLPLSQGWVLNQCEPSVYRPGQWSANCGAALEAMSPTST